MAIKRKTYKKSRKYKKTSVKHKKNRKTYRKKKGGLSDEPPINMEPLQEPETPDAPNFEPQSPDRPPPAPVIEPGGTPDNNNLVRNIEDLVVGNSYQVIHWYEIEEEDPANFYGQHRDNFIATLLRIDGTHLYFENITPKGDAEEGRDYFTWDNNRDLGIYNIGLPSEGPLFKGGKRRKK